MLSMCLFPPLPPPLASSPSCCSLEGDFGKEEGGESIMLAASTALLLVSGEPVGFLDLLMVEEEVVEEDMVLVMDEMVSLLLLLPELTAAGGVLTGSPKSLSQSSFCERDSK